MKLKLMALLMICYCCMAVKKEEPKLKVVKLEANIFVAETEVSNHDYQEFLQALLNKNEKEKYEVCLYDSTKWLTAVSNGEPMKEYYHRHAVYAQYPIVNISKKAMEYYCEWLTAQYEISKNRPYKKVIYRLPKEAEYKKINMPTLTKLTSANVILKRKGTIKTSTTDAAEITAPVYSYKPNALGIYNAIGNVSEVTLEGKIVGGNFTIPLEECGVGKFQTYALPDARVGFRYVMEIIEF